MDPGPPSRRAFLAAATGAAGVGPLVPDTGHRLRWRFGREVDATVYPVEVAGDVVLAPVVRPHRTDGTAAPQLDLYGLSADGGVVGWRRQFRGWPTVPTVADDFVVVQTRGAVRGFRLRDGDRRWTFPRATVRGRRVPVADGVVYLTALEGDGARATVHAFDIATGEPRWTATPRTPAGPALAQLVDGERLYLGDEGGVLALDRADGTRRWRTPLGEDRVRPVARRGERLYVRGPDAFVALDAAAGTERWRREFARERRVRFRGVIADGTAFVWGERLFALSAATGEERWQFEPAGTPGTDYDPYRVAVTVRDGTAYTVAGNTLYAFDAASGTERWKVETRDGLGSLDFDAAGRSVYLASGSTVSALAASNGERRWRHDADGEVYWLAVAGGRLFFATDAGRLFAVDRPLSPLTAPVATARRVLASPAGVGLAGLLGAGLLATGYRRLAGDRDPGPTVGRLELLEAGPATETYRKRVRTPDGTTTVVETRFVGADRREAFADAVERWAGLAVPGVLPVRDHGTDPEPWFETPFPAGGSLADAWPVARHERVEAASAVARTLHAVHRKGVARERLAPGDVVFEAPGAGRTARLRGWFLGDLLDAPDAYGPPGDEHGVHADVYRAGSLAHHLLAGTVPDPVPAPDGRSTDLDAVLARALAADPGDRYESALAFDDAFRWAAIDR